MYLLTNGSDLQTQSDISIPVLVILLEHICHALQTYTSLDKQVETHGILPAAVVGSIQQRHELLTQAISKGNKSLIEFRVGYTARVVGVEAVEEAAPGRKKPP